jgi:hypothetical protein
MKKLIAIFAVLLFAAPAMAADWSFYGSQRMATFYVNQDFGDFTQPGTDQDDDWGLVWNFQGNSRLGARVKADKVTGHIELALRATNGGDGGDDTVNTRRAYGVWKFADNASLKVGKDYTPVTNFLSGQVFDSDAGLLGQGNFYGRRPAMLALQVGGFDLAFITNALRNAPAPAGSDLDWNIPKIEASYTFKSDSFMIAPFGGFQYFKVSDNASVLQDDLDIYSYVVGLSAQVNIGAFYIAGQGAYGQNWDNAGWSAGRNPFSSALSRANLKAGLDDVTDSTSWSAMLAAGLKFTDTLKFEAGAGYRQDDGDIDGLDEVEAWEAYLQAVITLAPGVYLVPEGGYIDFMDNPVGDDLGYAWYLGAKWQIDF